MARNSKAQQKKIKDFKADGFKKVEENNNISKKITGNARWYPGLTTAIRKKAASRKTVKEKAGK